MSHFNQIGNCFPGLGLDGKGVLCSISIILPRIWPSLVVYNVQMPSLGPCISVLWSFIYNVFNPWGPLFSLALWKNLCLPDKYYVQAVGWALWKKQDDLMEQTVGSLMCHGIHRQAHSMWHSEVSLVDKTSRCGSADVREKHFGERYDPWALLWKFLLLKWQNHHRPQKWHNLGRGECEAGKEEWG